MPTARRTDEGRTARLARLDAVIDHAGGTPQDLADAMGCSASLVRAWYVTGGLSPQRAHQVAGLYRGLFFAAELMLPDTGRRGPTPAQRRLVQGHYAGGKTFDPARPRNTRSPKGHRP